MEDAGAGIYSIGAVSRMLGLERATIRNWEGRFGLVQPRRSAGGQRLFSGGDLERLRFVAGLVAGGVSPAAAHQRLEEYLEHGRALAEHEQRADAVGLPVLIVERDRPAAELTEFFLRREGYGTRSVLDSEQALAHNEQLRPRLAIVDLLISGGEGLSLCRTLKQQGLSALLAISPLATREAALEAGADAFLLKPVEPLQLVCAVRELLGSGADRALARKAGGGAGR